MRIYLRAYIYLYIYIYLYTYIYIRAYIHFNACSSEFACKYACSGKNDVWNISYMNVSGFVNISWHIGKFQSRHCVAQARGRAWPGSSPGVGDQPHSRHVLNDAYVQTYVCTYAGTRILASLRTCTGICIKTIPLIIKRKEGMLTYKSVGSFHLFCCSIESLIYFSDPSHFINSGTKYMQSLDSDAPPPFHQIY